MNSKTYCRICVKYYANVKLLPLSESIMPKNVAVVNGIFELWKIFTKILNVFDQTENHNFQICEICVEEIQRVYKFLEKCETNGNIWRRMQIESLMVAHQLIGFTNDQELCSNENNREQPQTRTNRFEHMHEQEHEMDVSTTIKVEENSYDCSDSEKLSVRKLEETRVVSNVKENEFAIDDSTRLSEEDEHGRCFNSTFESSSMVLQDKSHKCKTYKELYFNGTSSKSENEGIEDFERHKESETYVKTFDATLNCVCKNCKKGKEKFSFIDRGPAANVSAIIVKQPKNNEDSLLIPISNANSSDDNINTSQKHAVRLRPYIRYTTEQKELLIKCYEEGMTIKKAAFLAKLNYFSASSILRMYKRNDCQLIEKPCGGYRRKKVTKAVLEKIESCVENNPGVTLGGIKYELAQKNIDVCKSTIDSALRMLRVTLKTSPLPSHAIDDEATIAFRRIYAQRLSKKCKEDLPSVIFIGVCGYNIHFRHRQPRHEQESMLRDDSSLPIVRGRDVTSIVALKNSGIVHSSVLSQAVSSEKMCAFLQEMILQLGPLRRQQLIVIDNSAVYNVSDVKNPVGASGSELLFIPAYSATLNPTRDVFGKVKEYLRKSLSNDATREFSIEELIRQGIARITPSDCENYIRIMLRRLHVVLNVQATN